MKTIIVMIAGNASSHIENNVGSKREWYLQRLSHFNYNIKFIEIFENSFEYDFTEDDAWIITGSEYSVYDNIDWLKSFKTILLEAINNNIPILGICFGHQLLAEVLNGKVEKNTNGWEVGYSPINLTNNGLNSKLFLDFSSKFYAAETHQDVILELPKNCTTLAENDMGIQSFQYSNYNVYGVQFHPEFNNQIMDAYIKMRKDSGINISYPEVHNIKIAHNIFNNFIDLI